MKAMDFLEFIKDCCEFYNKEYTMSLVSVSIEEYNKLEAETPTITLRDLADTIVYGWNV